MPNGSIHPSYSCLSCVVGHRCHSESSRALLRLLKAVLPSIFSPHEYSSQQSLCRSPDPRVYASRWSTNWMGTSLGRPPRRRKCLPDPAEPTKKLNIWSLIKDFVGKDINHLSVPVHISEPICELQRRAEGFECSYLLDQVCSAITEICILFKQTHPKCMRFG